MFVCGADAVCASDARVMFPSACCSATGSAPGEVSSSDLSEPAARAIASQPAPSNNLAGDAHEWTAPPRGVEAPTAPPYILLPLPPPVGVEASPVQLSVAPPSGVEASSPHGSLTPRMRAVYERTNVRPRIGIDSIIEAISMKPDALGRKTEAIRRIALRTAVACDNSARLTMQADGVAPLALPLPVGAAAVVRCDGGPAHARPVMSAPCDVEGERIAVEVQRLLGGIPDAMLMYGRPPCLPPDVRRANLVDTISKYDAGTIAKGRAAIGAWVAFCARHALPQYAAPFGADYCVWFLREEDNAARARASSSSSRTGASVKHDRACALRWLAAVGCVPFDARESSVRRSAPPDSSREPTMTPMWEVAVVRHLLIIAVRYDGTRASIVRAYAGAGYIMCLASLRLLDALRSTPPQFAVLDGLPFFAGVAAYTKGHNTRANRRPMPWWTPAVSVDPSITDDEAQHALRDIFCSMSGAPSLFCELLNAAGQPCSLVTAVRFGTDRARPEHVAASLAYLFMWYHRLIHKLVRGFASVGDVPDSGVWRLVERPASKSFPEFRASNAAWVSECRARVLAAARKSPQRAHACYQRTLEELESGLILGPFSVNDLNAKPGTWRFAFGFGRWRPLPRFAIWQGSKWRCIDDAAVSGSNSCGTTTHETIVCDRPDLPLRIGLRFHELGVPPDGVTCAVHMGGGTDDAFAAYRRAPSANLEYTVVMVPAPTPHGAWGVQCFCVPGHNFGLVSAVLNFNSIPEPLVHFSRRYFGAPVARFYDDETVCEPSYASASGQSAHFRFRELLRFHFDVGKHQSWSSRPIFCGLCTDWSLEFQGRVSVGVTQDRRSKLIARIDDILAEQRLSPAEASSLRGKGRFCLSPVFGRMGVAILSALKRRQYVDKSSELTPELCETLRALRAAVQFFPNFTVPLRRELSPPIVVLTDASWEIGHTWIGFVVMCPVNGVRWAGVPTPRWLLEWLARLHEKQTYIGQLEVAAALAPYWSLPPSVFRSRAVSHYIDNQGALYSMIRGRSSEENSNRLVFLARLRMHVLRADVWFDYVPSASNIADLPTRLDHGARQRLLALGPQVDCLLPDASVLSASWDTLVSIILRNL